MPDETKPSPRDGPNSQRPFYVTTAIPYVNAPPHLGFALEIVQADVLARFHRLRGEDVRFLTGTDENSLKNVLAAERLGFDTAALVDRNAEAFLRLGVVLDLSFDDFIRTSRDQRHRLGVERLWQACDRRGDIYQKDYTGLYCVGCEQFYKAADLDGGRCPEHGTEAVEISERNYFFRLSRYRDRLDRLIRDDVLRIEPDSRRNEVLGWIESGLEDISISRSSQRARGWGIRVPGDPDQVVYVWFDALANYITALDYGGDGALFQRYWASGGQREHVIGKGISRFHALYWPAMLLSAGLPLPSKICVHGYVTVEGQKIGKSAGNAVDPIPLARSFGSEALRYYLLRHIRATDDGDFSLDRFAAAYRSDLAGQLGNLANRVLRMVERYSGGLVPAVPGASCVPATLSRAGGDLLFAVGHAIDRFAFHEGLGLLWDYVALANKFVADTAPWALAKARDGGAGTASADAAEVALKSSLSELVGALYVIALCCRPFLPATGARLLSQLGVEPRSVGWPATSLAEDTLAGNRVSCGDLLFPRLEDREDREIGDEAVVG